MKSRGKQDVELVAHELTNHMAARPRRRPEQGRGVAMSSAAAEAQAAQKKVRGKCRIQIRVDLGHAALSARSFVSFKQRLRRDGCPAASHNGSAPSRQPSSAAIRIYQPASPSPLLFVLQNSESFVD